MPATFELARTLIRPGGHIANIGVHGEPATLHLEELWIRDVTITTGLVDTYSTPTLLRLLGHQLDVGRFVTHHFAMDDFIEAYDVFARAADTGALKVGRDAMTAGRSASVGGTPRPALTRQSLDRAACLELLAPGGHGRVAATMRAVPVIIPVTFTLFGEDLMFSPGSGPDVARAVADSVVAFETDAIGPDGCAVWDVHVTGVARTLTPDTSPNAFGSRPRSSAGGRP